VVPAEDRPGARGLPLQAKDGDFRYGEIGILIAFVETNA